MIGHFNDMLIAGLYLFSRKNRNRKLIPPRSVRVSQNLQMASRVIPVRRKTLGYLICISAIFGLILHFYRSEKVIACGCQ